MAGIYIHIPFCKQRCRYCAFYSSTLYNIKESYVNALCKELVMRKDYTDGETIETIYLGGGTPSTLSIEQLKKICDTIYATYTVSSTPEVTIECNPDDLTPDFLALLKRLPFNRISMGVQSFDDGILKFMNRRHDADTARKAYEILEASGVENISLDLIFGLPQLSDQQWQETLDKALSISPSGKLPKHISSYQLSVEPGSMLAKMVQKGMWSEASDELCERQYRILCETLAQAGYHHYEISNFAHPGYEAVHNSAYWRHVPYVGLGPGAHSFVCGNLRMWNKPDLKGYIADPCGIQEHEVLDDEQLVLEKVMLALRTSEGISEKYLYEHCDNPAVKRAFAAGDLEHTASGNVRIPENRFFVSDSIISEIV